jgi:hypothetical protein
MATIKASTQKLKDGIPVVIRSAVLKDAVPFLQTVMTYIDENEGQVWEPGEFKKSEAEELPWGSCFNRP